MSENLKTKAQLCSAELKEQLNRIHAHCQNYKTPVMSRSIGQTALTLFLYAVLMTAIIGAIAYGLIWLSLLLSVPAAGLLVKLFIIQHDCGHGSYFKSKKANTYVGRFISVFTFTPFAFWRDAHNKHHAASGNLSKRGIGAIDTLTVREYEKLTKLQRFFYILYRHPVTMILIGPPLYIIVLQRFPFKGPMPFADIYHSINGSHLWRSVVGLNLMLIIFYGALVMWLGLGVVALAFLPALIMSASIGGWLFYVQHQYEETYWEAGENWDFKAAALLGSSHYDLPRILQWFSGNIGFHHIHHLSSLIPNYRLQECYEASPDLKTFPKLGIVESFKTMRLRLWDEQQKKMVGVH